MTKIVCRQLAPETGNLAANWQMTNYAIEQSIDDAAQIVVLPELITSGYSFESVAEAESLAIAPDHRIFEDWAALAAKGSAVVIGGFCERRPEGGVYNSAAVVSANGVVAVYRKLHLWDTEKNFFTPGSSAPPVLDTDFGRVAVVICYDMEFPELTRSIALRGADLLAVPTNWPLIYRPEGERPPETQIAIAAARVNRMSIACCDRAGTERGQAWTGGTAIINHNGWVVSTAGEGDIASAEIDLTLARNKQMAPMADAFGDRRPDFYGAVTEI